ncbi:MAG: hypothetical protein ACLTBR_08040 [Anaerostipes sp.]|uniref:hypothetical protein n=1 Tax=Anaerostipes sp. TaxID=1872530 RepID=UPI0039956EFB
MAKDLTNSRLDRQNILNNEIAVEEIQKKSGIEGILWEDKIFVTREMAANFFDVDIRTISRYLKQNILISGIKTLFFRLCKKIITAGNSLMH